MDYKKILLYISLCLVALMLWTNWQKDYPPVLSEATKAPETQVVSQTDSQGRFVPQSSQEHQVASQKAQQPVAKERQIKAPEKLVHIKTNTLNLAIDLNGGNIVYASLLKYPEKLYSATPYVMLNHKSGTEYLAQSGLTNVLKGNAPIVFTSEQASYQLGPDQKQLTVRLQGKSAKGLKITKTFTVEPDSYLVGVGYTITNNGAKKWQGHAYTQLVRANGKHAKPGMFGISSYFGASISDPTNKHYEKVSFDDMKKSDLNRIITGGWAAMQEHYFVSAWIPTDSKQVSRYYSHEQGDIFTVGMVGPNIKVSPGESIGVANTLYVGPEITENLKKAAPYLDLTIDYGWLWFISSGLFWLMRHIYNVVGNWGWSIVLVTLFIKLGFYHLSASSYRSMGNMRKLQPQMEALKKRYAGDKAKLSQATMELYKKQKVNPLGGCLPMLIQIPVFIALYWVLLESVELRQAPFVLWIHDLAAPDPFYILPVIMGATMFVQQKITPTQMDPMQAKMMQYGLPALFTFLFLHFPSGLVLYWIVNNVLSIAQQWYVTTHMDKKNKRAQKKQIAH